MAFTREQVAGQIAGKMQKGMTRQEAIDELLAGAKKGAGRAENEVTLAQDALLRAKTDDEIKNHKETIAREGRYAAIERNTIAILNQILEDDSKKQ